MSEHLNIGSTRYASNKKCQVKTNIYNAFNSNLNPQKAVSFSLKKLVKK
jgi:hypothetical protein